MVSVFTPSTASNELVFPKEFALILTFVGAPAVAVAFPDPPDAELVQTFVDAL